MKTRYKRLIGAAVIISLVILSVFAATRENKRTGGFTCTFEGVRSLALIVGEDEMSLMSHNQVYVNGIKRIKKNYYQLDNGNYVYWTGSKFGTGATKEEAKKAPFRCHQSTQSDLDWIFAGAF